MKIRMCLIALGLLITSSCNDMGIGPSRSFDEDIILTVTFRDLMTRVLPDYRLSFGVYVLAIRTTLGPPVDPSPTVLRAFRGSSPIVRAVSESYVDDVGQLRDLLTGSKALEFRVSWIHWDDPDHVTINASIRDGYSHYQYIFQRHYPEWNLVQVIFFGPA